MVIVISNTRTTLTVLSSMAKPYARIHLGHLNGSRSVPGGRRLGMRKGKRDVKGGIIMRVWGLLSH